MAIKIEQNDINTQAPAFKGGWNKVIQSDKVIKRIGDIGGYSSPQSRLIIGVTALLMQTPIDYYNKRVDEETRTVSAARTLAKAAVGTVTGVIVRYGCIKGINMCTLTDQATLDAIKNPFIKELRQCLIPTNLKSEAFAKATRLAEKHKQALGTFVALGVMLITNFALDVPLTKFFTNIFNDKLHQHKKKSTEAKGGK